MVSVLTLRWVRLKSTLKSSVQKGPDGKDKGTAQNTFTSLATGFSAFSHLGPILLQTDAAGKDMSCGHQNIIKTNIPFVL